MRLFCSLLALLACTSCATKQTPVDVIWSAKYVVTMDAKRTVIEDGAVAVRNDRIVAAGPTADIEATYSAQKRVASPNAILTPGLINTHAHAAMSLFRGIADDKKLQDWLQNFIFPAEAKNVDREFVR